MKRIAMAIAVISLIMVGQLALAGGQREPGEAAVGAGEEAALPRVTLQVGHIFPASHVTHRALEAMADFISQETDGGLVLDIFPQGQLGQGANLSENVMLGTVDMATAGPGLLSNLEPSFGIWGAEYVFRDVDGLFAVVDSDVGEEIFERMRTRRGLRVIGVGYLGARHLTTRNTRVTTPADLRGLKIRIPDIPYRRAAFTALGTAPTPMAFSELYLGLQQGVVDGQENPLAQIISMRFYEVQNYLVLTGHAQNPEMLIISDDRFNALPAAYQDVLVRAGAVFGSVSRELAEQEAADQLRQLRDEYGMTIVEPDLEAFRRAVAQVPQGFAGQWGEGTYQRVVEAQR